VTPPPSPSPADAASPGADGARDGHSAAVDTLAVDAPADDAAVDAPALDAGADAVGPPPVDAPLASDGPPGACGGCAAGEVCVGGVCKSKGQPVTPAFPPCTRPPCLNVLNNCAIPLWTHAVGTVPLDDGMVRRLGPGEQFQYAAMPLFGGGRLYAYYKEPESKQDRVRLVSDYNQFVEMTVDRDPVSGNIAQNYNVSYVDYVSLPVSMKATGAKCQETRCGSRYEDWKTTLESCPTVLKNQHEGLATCMGSYNYCITADGPATYDTTREYCSKMMKAHGHAGSAIYGGYFPDRPATDVKFWDDVAAWNRGTFGGDADERRYYKTEPYNHFARWIHEELACNDVYAFSTDDHQDKAGFVRCESMELNVVWCPYR
jgi:hypothetical protein